MRVDQFMTRPALAISPDATVHDARALMAEGDARHLAVVGHGQHLVGVLTDVDLRDATPGERVEGSMSSPAITAPPDLDVSRAASLMLENEIDCLPVVQRGRVIGIVTSEDLLALVVSRALRPDEGHAGSRP